MRIKSLVFIIFALFGHVVLSTPVSANDKVVKVLELYVLALEHGTASAAHPFYTPGTAAMMQKRRVNVSIMKLEAKSIRSCGYMLPLVKEQRAVIVFPYGNQDKCNPYFFVENDGQWLLDLETLMHVIRYDAKNRWQINDQVEHPYMFAFETSNPEEQKE